MKTGTIRALGRAGAVAALASVLAAGMAAAQGPGSTGMEILQIPAGGRAGALAGAYAALRGDADAVFYNPGALLGPERAAGLSYQRHVMDIALGSVAGVARLGRVALGAGFAFFDGGEIPEIVPDPDFGGQRGRPTGATVSARESATRIAVAAPLLDERVQAGAALGFALSELAGVSRSAVLFDVGVRTTLPREIQLGAALRNLGGSMRGGGAEPARLPGEARLGLARAWSFPRELGVLLSGDVVSRLHERSTGFVAGLEGGLVPPAADTPGAVLRLGYRFEQDLPAASALQLGAGISYRGFALDYHYQELEHFGAAHRIGVRWAR
jgi:hypothetical protein